MIWLNTIFVFFSFRIMFGTTQLYVFVNPSERDSSGAAYPNVTYEYAQEEIAAKSGFDMNMDNKSKGNLTHCGLVMPYRDRTRSTLVQMMACCLAAPSNYLNQCWLIISEVSWHSPEGNFTGNSPDFHFLYQFENYLLLLQCISQGPMTWFEQNGCQFTDPILSAFSWNGNYCIFLQISLKFVPIEV